MIHLVTGGSGSGKSAYAEEALTRGGKGRYLYIATMKPYGDETLKKIERHRELRAGKGFCTIECYEKLDRLLLEENGGVLLECVSNLVANECYREDGTFHDEKETEDRIADGISFIAGQTDHLVIVTNEVSQDVNGYSEETKRYIALLGRVNQRLACMADQVTEVVYGIPVKIK